jgi:DNA polymerase-1
MSAPLAAVTPAIHGTHWLSQSLGMRYTVGRPENGTLERLGKTIAVDIETVGLGVAARDIKSVTFANEYEAVVLDPRDPYQRVMITTTMAKAQALIFHNSTYDVPNLCINHLMTVEQCNKVRDTMIYARLAWPDTLSSKSLQSLCGDLLGLKSDGPTMTKVFNQLGYTKEEGYRIFDLDRAGFIFRAAMDALVTARLLEPVRDAAYFTLTENHPFSKMGITGQDAWELVEREQKLNRLFLRRSARGLRIDPRFPDEFRRQMHEERRTVMGILEQAGVAPNNANQLVAVLDNIGALPDSHPRTPKTKKPSTAKGHLEKIDHTVARAYVRLKEIEHVQSDYLDKCVELEVDGRVHPNTDVLKAVTGRVAMGSPPFHQFPSRGSMKIARNIVLADEGDSLTSLDWAQIEPVIAANIAHDTSSLNEYESGSGDMYAGIAKQAKISRDKAKVTLLAQLYGEGFAKLADTDSQWKGYGNLVDKLARSIAEERGELYQKSQVEVSGNPFAGFDEIDIGDDGKLRGVK